MRDRNPKEIRQPATANPLTAHRGLATWGERLVPLADFRRATAAAGRSLSTPARDAAREAFLERAPDGVAVEGPFRRIAVFGGVYSNHLALQALLDDARHRGAEALYCLGDLGGFGPNPDKIWPLLERGGARTIQGNYEASLSSGREDCNCGYTDPRDNRFARLSYEYTAQHCRPAFRDWMATLPRRRRVAVGSRELLLVHGSPRRINEFLFRSTSPDPFLETLLDQERCDGLLCTHTGLHWHRRLPSGRDVVNVGAIGRPANDGRTHVWYALLEEPPPEEASADPTRLGVDLVPLAYDHLGLAAEMRDEGLPREFVDTILSGWWTTCLEILPARERQASKF